jgi:SanA protein
MEKNKHGQFPIFFTLISFVMRRDGLFMKKLGRIAAVFGEFLGQLLLLFLLVADMTVHRMGNPYVTSNIHTLEPTEVALVLGTSRYVKGGGQNLYFKHRILSASQLYHTGKVRHLLLSGDNRHRSYNEPGEMRKALRDLGVPIEAMTLDYAGFRTFDSVIRAQKVFQQDRFIVVSQKFHNERAVAIGRSHGIQITGFNAADVNVAYGFKTTMREFFARGRLLVDLLFESNPYFLGDPVDVPVGNSPQRS